MPEWQCIILIQGNTVFINMQVWKVELSSIYLHHPIVGIGILKYTW